jgi:two-component system sensor histidine kinase/response regulator
VLVAEDNPINQRVATAMLEHLGFDVDIVAEGPEAVKAAILTPYRAILMDCQIPGLDGYQATSEIRRLQGPSHRTPIIAVTASTTESAGKRCLDAGMDEYLAKPLSLTALAGVLARWAPGGSLARVAGDAAPSVPDNGIAPGHADDPRRSVLDEHVVARLERLGAEAGEDLVGQLVTLFLADADARIGALRQALADGDAAALIRSAHTLSGSSANLGATDLSRLCATLATVRAAGDIVGRGSLVDGIEAELARVRCTLGSLAPAT